MQPNQPQPIVLTDFSGQSENPSIGSGVSVGLDLYTTKTVARLSRKMNQVDGGIITAFPEFITCANVQTTTSPQISFSSFTGTLTIGNTITGSTSGATATLTVITPGILTLSGVTGTFINGETLTQTSPTATVHSINYFPAVSTIVSNLYVQDVLGKVYQSLDGGQTWSVLGGRSSFDPGYGIIAWQRYLFCFTPTDIDVYDIAGASWTQGWWTNPIYGNQSPLSNIAGITHFPFASPANVQVFYFCNNSDICYIQWVSPAGTPFDPLDTTTFIIFAKGLILPNSNTAIVMGYLPPDQIAIGWLNTTNSSHIEVGIWDGFNQTVLQNIVDLAGASNPVTQMVTKNGVLYCVTDKEHGVYAVNGSSATLIDRLSLRMTNRTIGGTQFTTRVSSTLSPQGADFLGPELLTGGSNFPTYAPQVVGSGLYPFGVWSVNIETNAYGQNVDTGSTGVIGLRFPLSFGQINAQYSSNYSIGFIKATSNNSVLVGWQQGNSYGIDLLDSQNYISNSSTVFLESSLFLAGTRLVPRTFNTLEFNLISPLNAGEQIQFFWRTNIGMDYQPFPNGLGTFNLANMTDMNGVNISGAIQQLPFQNVKYIQIAAQINAGSNENMTPQLRDVILK